LFSPSQQDKPITIFFVCLQTITSIFIDRRDMLDEYFSLSIDDQGQVVSIPMLLPGYTPELDKLPLCQC
jgi:DNA mismatch repair protein MLH1